MTTTRPQLSDYKQQIDLVQFLETEGFAKDRRKSTRRWPVLENVEGRKLIIGHNQKTSEYFYYNPDDSRDKGTIVDYVIGKLNIDTSAKEGWQQLHEYLGSTGATCRTCSIISRQLHPTVSPPTKQPGATPCRTISGSTR